MARPIETFHGFCGQFAIVKSLRALCSGALAKCVALPHICLMGASGMGKTELANAVAKAMGTTFHSFFASPDAKRWQLARDLAKIEKKGDIFFLDEIHALDDSVQECLYPAIDKLRVPKVDPATNRIVENEWVNIPEFTLIAASDQPGRLKNALRRRLVLSFTLRDYDESEMRVIVSNRAAAFKLLLSPQAVTCIAQATRGVPRRAGHILQSLNTCIKDPGVTISKVEADRHLYDIMGVDKDGMEANDLKYLGILSRRKGFVSMATLALQLGLDVATVKREIELHLTKRELISVDSRGRSLTVKGQEFVKERNLA